MVGKSFFPTTCIYPLQPAAGALLGPESAVFGHESALLGPESALLGS